MGIWMTPLQEWRYAYKRKISGRESSPFIMHPLLSDDSTELVGEKHK